MPDQRVTAIIVNYRTPELTLRSVAALRQARRDFAQLDVIVVDGGSGDGSDAVLRAGIAREGDADWVTLLPLTRNGGFGWANNQAIMRALRRETPPDFVYLVNPDAVVAPGALAALTDALVADPKAAAAGSRLFDEDGRAMGAAFRFPTAAREFFRGANTPALERALGVAPLMVEAEGDPVAVDWVTGASVLFRAEALRKVGLFDTGFFLYFEEVELMHRLRRAGWRVLHVPAAQVAHIGGAATGVVDGASEQPRLPDYWFRSRRRFYALTQGGMPARLSGLAWLAGHGVWRLRALAGLGRRVAHAPGEWRDLLRNGLAPVALDRRAAVARWDDPLDLPPAWQDEG